MKYIPVITKILKKYGVSEAAIFGSVARGEAKVGSDLDILVRYPKGLSLFDVSSLKIDLEEKVGVQVDLVNMNKIKPRLRPYIEADKKVFLAV